MKSYVGTEYGSDKDPVQPTAMSPERFRQMQTLFEAAIEQPPAEALLWLRHACRGDTNLYDEIDSLLAADRLADGLEISIDVALSGGERKRAALPSFQGRRVGPYEILQEIGRGGMGAVYVARRADRLFSRDLCFKVVRPEKNVAELIRRFHREREIIARLDHPNIARMLDGGTTDEGLPYAIMEYVAGQPIDAYCDQQRLSVTERIQLIRTVCAAVQYAHQNLVIHLDLKPSNIVVKPDGTVKLLDFGIARLLRDAGEEAETDASFNVRLFTLAYASPEQIKGERVATTSDVYSLGVILYKLLTGHSLFPTSLPLHQLIDAACERDPVRPSEIVLRDVEDADSSDGPPLTAEQIGAVREGTPTKLARRLTGEIDNIVMMAVRKAPERRYSSVERLSDDLRRHLTRLPVVAQSDTTAYRVRKFVARHRIGVAAASLVLVFMALAVVTTGWQAGIAHQERARAEREAEAARTQSRHAAHEAEQAELYRQRAERDAAFATEQLRLVEQRTVEARHNEQRAAIERERADRRTVDARNVTEKLLELNTFTAPELSVGSESAKAAAAAIAQLLMGLRQDGYTDQSLDRNLATAHEFIGKLEALEATTTRVLPPGWQFSSRDSRDYDAGLDSRNAIGALSAYIRSMRAEVGAANLSQTIDCGALGGRRVRLSAMLKSARVEETAGIFVRLSDLDGVIADWYGEHPLRGTNSRWSGQAIVFDVPREATELTFGFTLSGRGIVWADSFSLEVVDASEPLTAIARVFGRGPVLTFEPPR